MIMCLLSVVEMRIEEVNYETTEGDGSLQVCAVMESVAVVNCLIGFTVYAYINTTDLHAGIYNIMCSSISIQSTYAFNGMIFILVRT